MDTMNKFTAFNKLMTGEISEMISPDGKSKYALVDGSIVTPRKKALDMKDMMEEGWSGKTAVSWTDHIGNGIFCIDEEEQNTSSFPLLITEMDDQGTGTDVNGADWFNLRPATLEELTAYLWDADATEKLLEKMEKAESKKKSKPVTTEPKAEETANEEPVVEKTEPVPEPVKEEEEQPVEEDTKEQPEAKPEATVGNDLSHSQSTKPTVKQKDETTKFVIESGVAQRKRYFQSLGLPTERWEEFCVFYNLTDANIEEFAGRNVSEVIQDIQAFVSQ